MMTLDCAITIYLPFYYLAQRKSNVFVNCNRQKNSHDDD